MVLFAGVLFTYFPKGKWQMCFTIVAGPPCSGKTTWVERNKGAADEVIDYDAIAISLGSGVEHDHGREMIDRVEAARSEMVNSWPSRKSEGSTAWVILTRAYQFKLVRPRQVDRIVVLATPLQVCEGRARGAGRSDNVIRVIQSYRPEYVAIERTAKAARIAVESVVPADPRYL